MQINNSSMSTTINERIDAFCKLGNSMRLVSEALMREDKPKFQHKNELPLFKACIETSKINPWFTQKEISHALLSLSEILGCDALTTWLRGYPELFPKPPSVKNIAVIMAGNIPLVGFHDLLCVIMSGHHFTGKLSSQDPLLPLAVAEVLISYLPGLRNQISFPERSHGMLTHISEPAATTRPGFLPLISLISPILSEKTEAPLLFLQEMKQNRNLRLLEKTFLPISDWDAEVYHIY